LKKRTKKLLLLVPRESGARRGWRLGQWQEFLLLFQKEALST
jgi:hypothetical protein